MNTDRETLKYYIEIFNTGFNAAKIGKPSFENPYQRKSNQFKLWDAGHEAGIMDFRLRNQLKKHYITSVVNNTSKQFKSDMRNTILKTILQDFQQNYLKNIEKNKIILTKNMVKK